ncbi:hypothetical protein NB703_003506 [Pantoea ananatis]|uniref:Uncharacterized protein n=1 Tax=Pantoea ananas TaxID=553 RepID=A0AAJ1D186_PANAN|nr:hypothetical protein [Pantoea ananatis]MCW0339092.1 hypothetical protein [Pantoea ananatis]MCW0345413.1 hypothetical protein [Pantoea ananatis]MCW0348312.1 hypothetical protein [Pantoea ananatis]MCW0355612.1 hypothetical protein [Pantoea ananatis]
MYSENFLQQKAQRCLLRILIVKRFKEEPLLIHILSSAVPINKLSKDKKTCPVTGQGSCPSVIFS